MKLEIEKLEIGGVDRLTWVLSHPGVVIKGPAGRYIFDKDTDESSRNFYTGGKVLF